MCVCPNTQPATLWCGPDQRNTVKGVGRYSQQLGAATIQIKKCEGQFCMFAQQHEEGQQVVE